MRRDEERDRNSGIETDGEESPNRLLGAGMVAAGLVLMGIGAVLFPAVVGAILGSPLSPGETWQLHFMRWGMGWVGLTMAVWGGYECWSRRLGPPLLISWITLFPAVAPFVFLGYGWDPDAWSVAYSAERIRATGEYWMSRPPGFPLFELFAAGVVPRFGWPGLFATQVVAGLAATAAWRLLPPEIPESSRRLVAVGMLAQPLFLSASTTGMDYVWQTAFVSGSAVLLIRGLAGGSSSPLPFLFSGVMLGVAAGFRLSSLVLLPVWILMGLLFPGPGRGLVVVLGLLGSCLVTTLVVEAPVWWGYGISAFRFYPDDPAPGVIAYRMFRWLFSPPVLVLLGVSLVCAPLAWNRMVRTGRISLAMAVLSLVVLLGTFAILPREPGYLTVLVPFLSLLIGWTVPRVVALPLLAVVVLWGFMNVPGLAPVEGGGFRLTLKPLPGALVEDGAERWGMLQRSQRILNITPTRPTVVIVGFDWAMIAAFRPRWVVENGVLRNPDRPVEFHDWVPPDVFSQMKREGRKFLVVGNAGRFTRAKYGYDPFAEGAAAWKD